MTIQGILILNFIGLALLFCVLNLVRHGKLYVGYGVIFVLAILGTMVLLSVHRLLTGVTHLLGAVFPASALTLLALCFIVLMVLYILTQLTQVSNRLAQLTQELAIREAKEHAERLYGQFANSSQPPTVGSDAVD